MKIMKNIVKLRVIITSVLLLGLLVTVSSCEEEKFDYPLLASAHDGIQNMDETGIDCGGSITDPCPSCSDGIQNGNETGVDCGGPDCEECPADTPRYWELSGLYPYLHTFELVDSADNLMDGEANSVEMQFGTADPAGSEHIVGKYIRPEGLVADGFSDYKFAPLESGTYDFSENNKFTLDVFLPTYDYGNPATFTPTVEIILLDNTNPTFWETWTVLSATIDASNFDSWVKLAFDGGAGLAGATIYNTIAIRIGGSNHQTGATFYVSNFINTNSLVQEGTPRADVLSATDLPFYFTWEAGDATSGRNMEPRTTNLDGSDYAQGVDANYGVGDPAGGGSQEGVTKINRPDDGRFGGFEDYKFEWWENPIDFSSYYKFTMDVFVPSDENDFDNTSAEPVVVLVLHDNVDGNFWQRWTTIPVTIDPADFDKWITITFDGTNAGSADAGIPLKDNTSYDNISLQFGGSGHTSPAVFYVKDFVPFL